MTLCGATFECKSFRCDKHKVLPNIKQRGPLGQSSVRLP